VITIGHDLDLKGEGLISEKKDPSLEEMVEKSHSSLFHLGEFYKTHPITDNRATQISFFLDLMKLYPERLYQIGQKTGAMDGGALLGIPTVYIEWGSNNVKARMKDWVAKGSKGPLCLNVDIDMPPSLLGKAVVHLQKSIENGGPIAKPPGDKINEFWRSIKRPDKPLKWRLIALLHFLGDKIEGGKDHCKDDHNAAKKYLEQQSDLQRLWRIWTRQMITEQLLLPDNRGYSKADRDKIEEQLKKIQMIR